MARRFFKGNRKKEVYERAQKLEALVDGEAKSLPELALRWILSRPEVSTVIPGMRTVEHVRQNCGVADGRLLSANLVRRLKDQAWERNFYG